MTAKKINNSLLYKLETDDMLQITEDYKSKAEYIFCIDANDILEYIDPFNKLYNSKIELLENQDLGVMSDNYYAFDLLLNKAKNRNFILQEYFIELRKHKDKIAKFKQVNDFIKNIKLQNNFDFDLDSKNFILENSSEMFFILSGYSKSIHQRFIDIFTTELINLELNFELELFSQSGDFEEIDFERISQLYKLFPENKVSDYLDAICIYKVFKMNEHNKDPNKKYIYFSSARKTAEVLEKLKIRIVTDDTNWEWLSEIVDNYDNERLIFFRDKKNIFGFSLYLSLIQRYGFTRMTQIKSLNTLFYKLCKDPSKEEINSDLEQLVYELILRKRESYESFTVLKNVYNKLKDFSKLDAKNDTTLKKIISKIQDYNDSDSEIIFKEDSSRLFRMVLSLEIKEDLLRFSSLSDRKIDLDRGNDNIISLFNVLPPIFVNDNSNNNQKNSLISFREKVEKLILFASNKLQDSERTNKEFIIELLENCKNNNDDFNNLLFLFILIFIKYRSKEGIDSNLLVYNYCIELESNLCKENELILSKKTPNPRGIKSLQLILRELKVLKIWSYRRMGHEYSDDSLLKNISYHKKLITVEYPEDYRFTYSLFLTKLNFIYDFIQINILNLERIIAYVREIITCGIETQKRINANYDINNEYVNYTLITLKNSMSFCYCVELDIELYGKTLNNSKITTENIDKLFRKVSYSKDDRKKEDDVINKLAFNEMSKSQPVYSYVEAYIEYLESYEDIGQIDRAYEAINTSLYSLEYENKNRTFFTYCCKVLKNLIEQRKNDLTINYESFIVKIDGPTKNNFE